jgi:hypothetical protein
MVKKWRQLRSRPRYTVERIDEAWRLNLHGQPDYCRALPMAPAEVEPELKEGLWLVLVSAIWSGPDRMAIGLALSTVSELGGRARLGIRLFDDEAETRAWFPELPRDAASPVWLLLRDGRLLELRFGSQTASDLRGLLEGAISTMAEDV